MSLFSILIVFIFWSVFYLIHSFLIEFKYTSIIYAKFLSKNGFTINIFQLKWYTVKCNRLLIRLSSNKPKFLKSWFNFGVIIGVIGQFISLFLLSFTLYDYFQPKPANEQILVPVLPGVNLPVNQTLYYFLALFICGIFHELGHAIAASREQVRVNGFGVFIMFIFPGAFVDLCSDHLQVIAPIRQLRIFCGGVWHNLVIVIIAFACIQAHPYFLATCFDKNVYVGGISENSPLKSLISENSIIQKVDACEVSDRFTFYECLYKLDTKEGLDSGYCMSLPSILQLSSNIITKKDPDPDATECCYANSTISNYCFKWTSLNQEIFNRKRHFSCLPARQITDMNPCTNNIECNKNDDLVKEVVCAKPVRDNSTRLVKIVHNKGKPILYVGAVNELIYSIQINEYRPKFRFIPDFLNYQLLLLLKYLIAFSGAIGLLNMVPCFSLDGQYILAATLQLFSYRKQTNFIDLNSASVEHPMLYAVIMVFGTGLLVCNIMLAFYSLYLSKLN